MRTTLDIPQILIRRAQRAAGLKTKTEVIIVALEELIRWKGMAILAQGLAGKTPLNLDNRKLRRLRKARVVH